MRTSNALPSSTRTRLMEGKSPICQYREDRSNSSRTNQSYLKRSPTQLLAAQSPKWRKVLNDGIKLVHELKVVLLCKLPPVVESPRWIPSVAALVLCDGLGECLALFREPLGKCDFGIGHEGGYWVLGDGASVPREREPAGREPGCSGGCSVCSSAVMAAPKETCQHEQQKYASNECPSAPLVNGPHLRDLCEMVVSDQVLRQTGKGNPSR